MPGGRVRVPEESTGEGVGEDAAQFRRIPKRFWRSQCHRMTTKDSSSCRVSQPQPRRQAGCATEQRMSPRTELAGQAPWSLEGWSGVSDQTLNF